MADYFYLLNSKNKLPWLFIIALFPVVGLILYMMIGNGFRETFRYRRRMKQLGPNYQVLFIIMIIMKLKLN